MFKLSGLYVSGLTALESSEREAKRYTNKIKIVSNMNYTFNKRCTAHITINRGRLREYTSDRIVHLSDGQEFEIELFNPHTKSVLAKIFLNGTSIFSGGIVIKPGQRAYLERFLDTDHKFKFSTYEIEGSRESIDAIAKNGEVEVQFFYQQEPLIPLNGINFIGSQPYTQSWPWNINYSGGYYNGGSTVTIPDTNWNLTNISNTSVGSISSAINSSMNVSNYSSHNSTAGSLSMGKVSESIETGRTERGSKSDQEFGTSYESFNSFSSEINKMKILPLSQKPVEVSEIRNYCPNCRTRIKKATWKFCPSCGEELNK